MSDSNQTSAAAMSDEMLLTRLFELVAAGGLDSSELAQIDAAISERLQHSYGDDRQPVMKLVHAQAA
jgi:hypothetical protein